MTDRHTECGSVGKFIRHPAIRLTGMEVQLVSDDGEVIDSCYTLDDSVVVTAENGHENELRDNRPEGEKLEELRERVQECVAEPYSDEGQEVIGDEYTGHVTEVWEDFELTSTKDGDLYRSRSLHQVEPPVFPEGANVLFTPDGEEDNAITDNHVRMVVTDRDRLTDILAEWSG